MPAEKSSFLAKAVRVVIWYSRTPGGAQTVTPETVRLFQRLDGQPAQLWTPVERRQAWKLLGQYKGVLLGFDIEYERIPEPPATGTRGLIRSVAEHERSASPAPPPPAANRRDSDQEIRAPSPGIRTTRRPVPPTPGAVAQPAAPPSVAEALGPGGLVARQLAGYEHRPQQLEMAEAVSRAIEAKHHLVVEAGTGTGKSLGYLVPALLSGKRVIVSTANKALQEQLVDKDLPFLRRVLPTRIASVLLKGRSNYLCLYRLGELRGRASGLLGAQGLFRNQTSARSWPQLDRWARTADEGDLDRVRFQLTPELRELVTIDADACLGQKCPEYEDCFVFQQRRRARDANVVVVNHDLLVHDAALRFESGGEASVLPEAEVLVLDEAHHLEERATRVLGASVERARWARIQRQIVALTSRHPAVLRAAEQSEPRVRADLWEQKTDLVLQRLEALLDEVAARLRPGGGASARLGDERRVAAGALEALATLVDDLRVGAPSWLADEQREAWAGLAVQASGFANDLELIVTPGRSDELVRFATLERQPGGQRVVLQAVPLEVGAALKEQLFDAFPTVVATSATLASTDGFAYWRSRVGLASAEELVLPSPFDFASKVLLYLPERAAELDPALDRGERRVEYLDRLAAETLELVTASRGRAFCLFSSVRTQDEVFRRLQPKLAWPLLRQGDGSRQEMLREFARSGKAVLFGVRSFWEGVDVVGEALSLVVIDKIPFPPPDDPVWAARSDAVNRRRGDPWASFQEMSVPYATLLLKQGFGRLIRSHGDRGVVALLDGRLTTKRYGPRIIDALPPAARTRLLGEVRAFFAES